MSEAEQNHAEAPGRGGEILGSRETVAQFWWLIPAVIGVAAAMLLPAITGAHARKRVVVYCAQDQVYAQPIFRDFEQETGIKVWPVFDSEAVKTVGLANRLVAEKNHPQADVFWGNEEMRTRQLAEQGVLLTNGWVAFGYRSRRMVINTNHVNPGSAPKALGDLTNAAWTGKVALAYPQFGTTSTHFHALRAHWGEAAWESWCHGLVRNRCLLVDGNSVVAKMVGQGEAWIGLTDSDDIAAGQREGLPIAALPLSAEMLLIPNTAGVVNGAPRPGPAGRFQEYLQRPEVARKLVEANALEGATNELTAATLQVDWAELLRNLDRVTADLNRIFLR